MVDPVDDMAGVLRASAGVTEPGAGPAARAQHSRLRDHLSPGDPDGVPAGGTDHLEAGAGSWLASDSAICQSCRPAHAAGSRLATPRRVEACRAPLNAGSDARLRRQRRAASSTTANQHARFNCRFSTTAPSARLTAAALKLRAEKQEKTRRHFVVRCRKAGVLYIRVHDTRWTCASSLVTQDVHPARNDEDTLAQPDQGNH